MPNNIPHRIHLFWAGNKLPEFAIENLISFMRYLPEDWKIYLWLTDISCINKSNHFKHYEQTSNCLVIKTVDSLLTSNIFQQLKNTYPDYDKKYPFKLVRDFIMRELIGLGNPAAAKDAFVPLCLYAFGGYYFDLDTKATQKITPPEDATYGVLVKDDGRSPQTLATEKEHLFCALALMQLIENCVTFPDLVKTQNKQVQHFTSTFFNLQLLRDRTEPLRNVLTGLISGSIIRPAYLKYASIIKNDLSDPLFHKEMNFPYSSKNNISILKMGVEFRSGTLELSSSKKSTITSNRDYPLIRKFKLKIPSFFTSKKEKKSKKNINKDTLDITGDVENWRKQKKSKSFEAEDITIKKK